MLHGALWCPRSCRGRVSVCLTPSPHPQHRAFCSAPWGVCTPSLPSPESSPSQGPPWSLLQPVPPVKVISDPKPVGGSGPHSSAGSPPPCHLLPKAQDRPSLLSSAHCHPFSPCAVPPSFLFCPASGTRGPILTPALPPRPPRDSCVSQQPRPAAPDSSCFFGTGLSDLMSGPELHCSPCGGGQATLLLVEPESLRSSGTQSHFKALCLICQPVLRALRSKRQNLSSRHLHHRLRDVRVTVEVASHLVRVP